MKTNITLNIGLSTIEDKPVELHQAIREIERAGITLLASGIVTGAWEGKAEQTLVLQGLAFDSPELLPRLYSASRALSQHCIAVWRDGKGELVGSNAQGWSFDAELFHFHARESSPELSPCQAVQAKHAARAEETREIEFDCEERNFIARVAGGEVTLLEILCVSPRNGEELEVQALSELEDCGTFEE